MEAVSPVNFSQKTSLSGEPPLTSFQSLIKKIVSCVHSHFSTYSKTQVIVIVSVALALIYMLYAYSGWSKKDDSSPESKRSFPGPLSPIKPPEGFFNEATGTSTPITRRSSLSERQPSANDNPPPCANSSTVSAARPPLPPKRVPESSVAAPKVPQPGAASVLLVDLSVVTAPPGQGSQPSGIRPPNPRVSPFTEDFLACKAGNPSAPFLRSSSVPSLTSRPSTPSAHIASTPAGRQGVAGGTRPGSALAFPQQASEAEVPLRRNSWSGNPAPSPYKRLLASGIPTPKQMRTGKLAEKIAQFESLSRGGSSESLGKNSS